MGNRYLSDISWLSGMENLRNVRVCIWKEPKLKICHHSWNWIIYTVFHFSSQESMENEEIMIQAEHIKAEKPEVSFYIFE